MDGPTHPTQVTLEQHRACTAALMFAYRSRATLEQTREDAWQQAFMAAYGESATARDQLTRAATLIQRKELLRIAGEIAALEAQERFLARALECGRIHPDA